MLFERAIKSTGLSCDVKVVRDGEQVLQYLRREGKFADTKQFPFPRVMILDLKMPRKNGFEVLQWLKEHPECKIIPTMVFSSSQVPQDVIRAYQLGVNSYFNKPNDYEELKSIFHLIINYWNRSNLPPIPPSQSCM
jgi:CheY-like chemotaxis protein